ncbi:hypothetical protein E2562_003932 [Oryza meyeriana var. granulata]|uniref:Uncharacterized protein n=1 Tax=Oryza meyeriana var. granulata TaxID=110450 RepID=A0A6G1CYS8_9ORYZ|nr:hypothetical protein E2562_003932 [Oryza meyeriana var. granulata]
MRNGFSNYSPCRRSIATAAASRLLVHRTPPHLLRRIPRALAARPSPQSSSGAVATLGRPPLGHRAQMGHTAAASVGPVLGLTKPNSVELP